MFKRYKKKQALIDYLDCMGYDEDAYIIEADIQYNITKEILGIFRVECEGTDGWQGSSYRISDKDLVKKVGASYDGIRSKPWIS